MRKIKLLVAYNGKNYSGSQIQPNSPTIQGELEKALSTLLGEKIKLFSAGRTDAGVHATGQVAAFKTNSDMETRRIKWSLNAILAGDIVIQEAEDTLLNFDPRKDAKSRVYEYLILNRDHKDIFNDERVHHEARPLDFEAMRRAAALFLGRHNFSSFTAASGWRAASYVKTVFKVEIDKDETGLIRIEIEADGFLHHMVRFIAGALIQLGLGVISQSDIEDMLAGRLKADYLAPARGLTLTQVNYGQSPNL